MKTTKQLNANQLKMIAIAAMTIDHFTSVIFPNYPTNCIILLLHMIGRITAPIMWFFIVEGFHYTRNWGTFCADWSSIAVVAILQMGRHRGDFKRQMAGMIMAVSIYTVIYILFVNPVYGVVQMFVVLSIPLLKRYNGEQGEWRGMKWFFYLYYPLHLIFVGILRVCLYGNIGVMIGG